MSNKYGVSKIYSLLKKISVDKFVCLIFGLSTGKYSKILIYLLWMVAIKIIVSNNAIQES